MSINDLYIQCLDLQVSKKEEKYGLHNMLQSLHHVTAPCYSSIRRGFPYKGFNRYNTTLTIEYNLRLKPTPLHIAKKQTTPTNVDDDHYNFLSHSPSV